MWTLEVWHDFVHFRVIFVQIKIFSMKMLIPNYISRCKMNRFSFPDGWKASSGLIRMFTIKKMRNNFESCFLEKLDTNHFSHPCSANDEPNIQSNDAQWTKNSISRNCSCFLASTQCSSIKWNFDILFEILLNFINLWYRVVD